MDPAHADLYDAFPVTCHGCATRDLQKRQIAKDQRSGEWGDGAFDGMYVVVTERGAE